MTIPLSPPSPSHPPSKKAKTSQSTTSSLSSIIDRTNSPPLPPNIKPTTTIMSTHPDTPPHNNLNASAPGELSPPRSQHEPPSVLNGDASTTTATIPPNNSSTTDTSNATTAAGASLSFTAPAPTNTAAGDLMSSSTSLNQNTTTDTTTTSTGAEPGEWKSKKSQDEMARAWEFMTDKDWSAKEFGDVIALGRKARGLP